MTRLRNYFLTGFIVTAPLAITAYLAWSFVGWVDSWVKPYIPGRYNPDNYLPFAVPGFGLIVALMLITLVGFLTANFIGRTIVSYGEYILDRMPLVRSVYRGLKQIFETVLSNKADMFNKVALIEYPRKGVWSIVFIASDKPNEVSSRLEDLHDEVVAVFMPTTPNPTTGFLMYVPRTDVIEISMSIEDAAKLIISAGLVAPEYQAKTARLAEEARKSDAA
ncbi:DUF502 domain-containing protein [Aquamicrobium sp. LC103]|uniref:DUF502 domain-containing protein n=1 Tax=Aquamicrobium sp. LC103 TaxID=1120658 RepID=UPI00063EAC5C|nr:DUF502 domain-containing protein [Aquamicrobium sp. LC103]TKT79410.1 DUF502 domain-containing protein [Aquamicrobium sp. LC103]